MMNTTSAGGLSKTRLRRMHDVMAGHGHRRLIARQRPCGSATITSEIISPDMSALQNRVRHVDEPWFGEANRPVDQRRVTMRFMVIVKADRNSEAGVVPSTELLTAMGKFNEEMVKAGVLLAGDGLHPSSKGARIKFPGKGRTVSRGPFGLTGDLVAGFWLIQVKSLDEAIEWMKRAPFDDGSEIEIRQVFDAEDFGEALTPELREQEQRLRAQAGKKQG
jgi:hypothetical protein